LIEVEMFGRDAGYLAQFFWVDLFV